ncbi:MAG TPA: hypothetical protein HA298_08145 [Methanobacteriales archaeon]|nr:hypothetical protein [Methanobacteriaceae archaeon]MBC7096383.1 hypothetical protein [Methanobacteriales archaeon]HIH62622.1 hypothetical protein [Methanobacteriales archaeon]
MKLTHIPALIQPIIELPGVKKENINFEITEQGYCLNCKRHKFQIQWLLGACP